MAKPRAPSNFQSTMWKQAIANEANASFDWREVCVEALHTRASLTRFQLLQDCEFRVKHIAYLKAAAQVENGHKQDQKGQPVLEGLQAKKG